MPRRVSSPIFVGRVAERAALSEALERAAAGQPGVVLITGEAGIGKSRLLAEAATLATSNGIRAVGGICVDVAAETLAYAPFVEIVRDLHRGGFTKSLPAATQAELARVVPEVASERREGFGGGQGGQGRLFAAIRDLLETASTSSPILVTIEDLHWADAATLDLVTYLARSMQSERYLLVATSRLDTLPRRHPLVGIVAELARLPWLERVDLARFDERELVQQLTGILGRVPDPGLAHDVFERSDGNAFFAEELIAAGAVGGSPLPASLREVLAARLSALDEVTRQVVRVAAVAGRVVSHDLLEQVAGTPPPVLISALREAVDQRVLLHLGDPVPGYAFRHALLREAAYDELLEAERVAIHRAIRDALEGDESLSPAGELARTGEIAFHAMAGGDLTRALVASRAAADVAERASAHAEAEVHLDRIIQIWPRVGDAGERIGMDHADVLAWAARAAASAGHQSRAVALAEDALGALDPTAADRRVAILLELFDYAWEAADIGAAERSVGQAMSMVGEEWTARSGRAFAADALLHWHHGRYAQAGAAARRAVAISRESGAHEELGRAVTIVGQVFTHIGETNNAEVAFAEAAAILDEVRNPVLNAGSARWRAWARTVHGRFEEGLAQNRQGLEMARRDGTDGRYGVHLLDGALENLIELGRWDEARTVGNQILASMSTSLEMVGVYMSLARMDTLLGRPADAEAEIARAAAIPAFGPHRLWQLEDAILLAYSTGRHGDGRRLMESAIAAAHDPERDAILWWALLKSTGGEADRADAARRRRRAVEVEDAVVTGRRYADLLRRSVAAAIEADGAGPMAPTLLLGADAEVARLEGRPDPASWSAVVEARRELKQPWERAYAEFRHAEAILASGGSASDAVLPLRAAHATATSLGAAPLRIAIEALASRARIRMEIGHDASAAGVSVSATNLSARELEVLTLVAAGHTNREIGERLFISEKTASVHVTHAMDKLGALSRYEAAAMATRLGLLEEARLPR
ncbi:MAG TPA: AAA family ATPase [Candidatus Limnocylindrales bacterium]|nr:AAA family ATPase [Candidatus Limnocylindrales bacterium]